MVRGKGAAAASRPMCRIPSKKRPRANKKLQILVLLALGTSCMGAGGKNAPNAGAFEGGPTGTAEDTKINNVIQVDEQRDNGEFDMPTGGPPSPLFDAEDWVMTMLRFEEFGAKDVQYPSEECSKTYETLPIPKDSGSFPDSQELDDYLAAYLQPPPTEHANGCGDENSWKELIESYLKRELKSSSMEGRPPGEHWKHQRWKEFLPQKYYQTVTTGARTNNGLRMYLQSHEYSNETEFGSDGLHSNQFYGLDVQFHPMMPVQKPESFWGFDGTFPPKLAMARYGEPLLMRQHNALPVDVTANRGFGVHVLTTHEHNGHNPAESDGYTTAFFFPGQYYDYIWPIILAGHSSINVGATDPRAGTPDGKGGIKNVPGHWREVMSTHWMHDHTLDFTAANVYKGSAAMLNIYSSIDRGNEAIDDGVNLRFPSGTYKDWGNRDYDMNLMLADKAWDEEGQLWFNPHNVMGFIGDRLLVNWCYRATVQVRARRYRFRILNGSVSRFFKVAMVAKPKCAKRGTRVPVFMIGNDGNIMEHAVLFKDGILPVQGIAERYDVVVDFSRFKPGDEIYMVNMMQHKNGMKTDRIVPLEEIMNSTFHENLYNEDGTYAADPVVGKFLRIVVREYDGVDLSMNPRDYVEGKKRMIPIRRPTKAELATATHRSFEFEQDPQLAVPWGIGTDGGKSVSMDPLRVSAAIKKDPYHLEVWRLFNSGSWSHPLHIHFEEAVVLYKDGQIPPPHERLARKDVFRLSPDEESATVLEIVYHFRDFNATFMGHCHNTQHEDHAMLMRWDVENHGSIQYLPAPISSWEGFVFKESYAVETARTGDGVGADIPALDPVKVWFKDITFGDFDLATIEIGDALNPTEDERGWVDLPLRKGTMKDSNRVVWFVLHDVSDEEIADEWGLAFAGGLNNTPDAALAEDAIYDPDYDSWVFGGDLPNPVKPVPSLYPEGGIPEVSDNNTYSSYRRVVIDGKSVIVNAFFVKWGDEVYEQLRVVGDCVFPDDPPNTACMYNGPVWGNTTGHVLSITTQGDAPVARFKLHKAWAEDGDYAPYYVVVDSFPAPTAHAMGVIYVAKHKFLGQTAVPLIQFLPGERLHPSYPPTPEDGFGLRGGGPLGGQIGIPSYFMPGIEYSPAWHIGFAHWNHTQTEVVKSLDRVKELREAGDLTIHEFPPPKIRNDYNFTSLTPAHVVNCPTPLTIDLIVHKARAFEDAKIVDFYSGKGLESPSAEEKDGKVPLWKWW